MNLLTLDHIIVYSFLFLTLAVGLYYGRGIKTLRSYAIADRSYNSSVITITLIATMIGGCAVIGDLIETLDSKFLFVFSIIGYISGVILLSIFVSPKFDERFADCISIGDVLKNFLGVTESKVACLAMFVQSIFSIGAQFIVLGHLCKNFLGMDYESSVVLTSLIIIYYSTFGGIKSVTMTDVLQFFVLIIAIPVISTVLLSKADIKVYDVEAQLQNMFDDKIKVIDYLGLAIFWIVPLHLLEAPIVQRYLMVQSTNTKLSKITLLYASVQTLMLLMLLITTTCFLKLHPGSESSDIMSIILQNHLSTGLRGFVIAGIIAVIMSTADSYLNASSVLFVKNILPKSYIKNDKSALLFTKLMTSIVGLGAMFMALQGFRAVTLMVYAHTLLIAASSIPILAGLFGFKVNRLSFWIGLFTAGVTYTVSKYMLPEFKYIHSLFTLIASFFAFFISHYIINHGFAIDEKMRIIKHKKKRRSGFKIPVFKDIEQKLFYKFTRKTIPISLFVSFCYINFLYTLFLFATQAQGNEINYHALFVASLSAFLCTILLLKDMFVIKHQKKYLPKIWLFTLCYCIPFTSVTLWSATHGATYAVILFVVGLLLLSYLVDWFLFTIITILGIAFGYVYNIFMFKDFYINIPQHTIIISIISLAIAAVVIRTRQNQADEQIKNLELFGGAMAHEAKSPMNSFVMNNSLLKEITEDFIILEQNEDSYKVQLSKHQYEMLKELTDFNEVIGKSGRIAVDLLLLAMKNDEMESVEDFSEYSVKECLDEAINEFVLEPDERESIKIDLINDFSFRGSKTFMKATIINLIKNSFRHARKSDVQIDILVDTNKLVVRDNGSGVPEDKLEKIFEKYYTSHGEGTGIGLALCDKFMQSIGGSIKCDSKEGSYAQFTLLFNEIE